MVGRLAWTSDEAPLPERVITAAEMILDRTLPASYKALVKAHPGGRPAADAGEGWLACVGQLISLDPRRVDNVFATIGDLNADEQIPDAVVPVITDGGGNMICLDYRAGAEPAVVYWQHDLDGEEAFVPIADSFDAFLAILEAEAASGGGARR